MGQKERGQDDDDFLASVTDWMQLVFLTVLRKNGGWRETGLKSEVVDTELCTRHPMDRGLAPGDS